MALEVLGIRERDKEYERGDLLPYRSRLKAMRKQVSMFLSLIPYPLSLIPCKSQPKFV